MGKYYNKFYRNFKKWDKDLLVSNCCGTETEKEFERVDYNWKKHIWKIN